MSQALEQLDPQWAWSPYEPEDGGWDRSQVAHLHRRAGFAANWHELQEATQRSPADVLRRLSVSEAGQESLEAESEPLAQAMLATGKPENLAPWWLYRMRHSPQPLVEKMTLFWHGHFATSAAKVEDARLMWQQNQLLRRHALGSFVDLVQGISRDPAMLIYLDSDTNRKAHPNENYARELMELFCLGEGHYSEQDVQQLARCFTGWEVRRGKFRFNRYQHDSGEKQILSHRGQFGGEQGVNLVLDHPETPRFIVRKLVRFFVCDEPAMPERLIEPLAEAFRAGGLQIGPLVERILGSRLFFSPHAVARKIRSPVELGVGLLRGLQASTDLYTLAGELRGLGQGLFFPPNVKGWEGGRAWINSSSLLGRANLVQRLLDAPHTRFAGGSPETLAAEHGWQSSDELVEALSVLMLAEPLDEAVRRELVAAADEVNPSQRAGRLIYLLSALPEFQLA